MKKIRLILLVTLIVTLNSCNKDEDEYYTYSVEEFAWADFQSDKMIARPDEKEPEYFTMTFKGYNKNSQSITVLCSFPEIIGDFYYDKDKKSYIIKDRNEPNAYGYTVNIMTKDRINFIHDYTRVR